MYGTGVPGQGTPHDLLAFGSSVMGCRTSIGPGFALASTSPITYLVPSSLGRQFGETVSMRLGRVEAKRPRRVLILVMSEARCTPSRGHDQSSVTPRTGHGLGLGMASASGLGLRPMLLNSVDRELIVVTRLGCASSRLR